MALSSYKGSVTGDGPDFNHEFNNEVIVLPVKMLATYAQASLLGNELFTNQTVFLTYYYKFFIRSAQNCWF